MSYEDEYLALNREYLLEVLAIHEKDYPKEPRMLDGGSTMDIRKAKSKYYKKIDELKKKYNVK